MASDLSNHRDRVALLERVCSSLQSFGKVSALNALAPTQSEPPFAITQAVVLLIFILIALIAAFKFRPPTAARV